MKKYLILFLALAMFFSFTALISASEEGKLLIWADENRIKVLNTVKDQFEAEYGISIEIQEKAFGDIRDNMAVGGASGEGPDIIVGAHDWLGALVSNGLISPIELGDKKDDFYPVALEAFSWGEDIYALPYAIESVGLIYNKNIIPDPPKNFTTFETIVKNVTDKKKEMYGFIMPQPDPYHTFPFMSATGGYVFGLQEGVLNPLDIGLNNDGATLGLQKLDKLYEDGYIPFVDYQTMTSLFTNGQVGMMLTGPWALPALAEAGIDYGFTQLPHIEGQPPKPFVGVQGFMISAFSKNKILAQAFLNEFIANKETMMALYEEGSRPPVYIPAAEEVADNPDMAGVLESAADGIPMPSIPEMASVWEAWSDALELVLTQKQDVKPALDNAVAQIEKAIKSSQ
ncbi:MAG: maltose ABC transporter substrate-binding protein [Halanaerobiales bacterium]|nr:maltose ABC transporter substrate-binding protein [Halanaerobiales bacterium]